MALKKIRIVGYLPPQYYQKLREYIEVHDLSESGALVGIVKQFFDAPVSSDSDLKASFDRELASLRAEMKEEMEGMRQRLEVLEAERQMRLRSYRYPPSHNSWND